MDLAHIDQLLTAWDERLRRVADNLLALEGDTTYRALSGAGGVRRVKLAGVTRERVEPAIEGLEALFERRARLVSALQRVREIRATISTLTFWQSEDKVAEIRRLL